MATTTTTTPQVEASLESLIQRLSFPEIFDKGFFRSAEKQLLKSDYKIRTLVVKAIADLLFQATGFEFKSNGSNEQRIRFYCTGSGTTSSIRSDSKSRKVGCLSHFCLGSDMELDFKLDHKPECKQVVVDPKSTSTKDIKKKLGEEFLKDIESKASKLLEADNGLRPVNVKRYIQGLLPPGQFASPYLKESLYQNSLLKSRGNIKSEDSMQEMINNLQSQGREHSIKFGQNSHGKKCTDAVFMEIKEISDQEKPSALYTADVTFGVVEGFKLSLITKITPNHSAYISVCSCITSEDTITFEKELEFLIYLEPTLPSRIIVFLVDGDRGRIRAIRKLLPLARVYLCWWHKCENIKAHFSSALSKLASANGKKPKTKQKLKELLKQAGISFTSKENLDSLKGKYALLLESSPVLGKERGEMDLEADLINLVEDNCLLITPENEDLLEDDDTLLEGAAVAPLEKANDDESVITSMNVEENNLVEVGTLPLNNNTPSANINATKEEVSIDNIDELPELLLTDSSCKQLFMYIRGAKDQASCLGRLELVKKKFPSLTGYVDSELKPTMIYWAEWARTWGLTFNLTSATMQENVNWTIKSGLGPKNSLQPHQLIDYVTKQMKNRQDQLEYRRKGNKVLKELQKELNSNLKTFSNNNIFEEGKIRFNNEANASLHYWVKIIEGEDLSVDLQNVIKFDRASGNRFSVLVSNSNNKFFHVQHESSSDKFSIVALLENRAVACSCGEHATFGAPDRHILAVWRKSYFPLNIRAHFHPIYWASQVESRVVEDPLHSIQFSNSLLIPARNMSTVSWNSSYEQTVEGWNVKGLGAAGVAAFAWNEDSKRKLAPTKREQNKLMARKVESAMNNDPNFQIQVEQLFLSHLSKQGRPITLPNGEIVHGPDLKKNESTKRAPMNADFNNKKLKKT